jgi:hypothetical protein
MTMLKEIKMTLIAGAAIALLGACQQAESPAEVRDDVADAQQDAREENTQVQTDAYEDTAMTKAEGEHKIAIERCEALAGDEQQLCKDQADAALEAAKQAADQPGT